MSLRTNVLDRASVFCTAALAFALGGCAAAGPAARVSHRSVTIAAIQPVVPAVTIHAEELHTLQLVRAVASSPTSTFRGQPRRDLTMLTNTWDPVPSVMTEYTTGLFVMERPLRVTLAGDAAGTAGWEVDNFLLIEVLDANGNIVNSGVVGENEPVTAHGSVLPAMAPRSFTFGARQVDLAQWIPRGQPFALRVTALDYGAVGHTSDVFLVVEAS